MVGSSVRVFDVKTCMLLLSNTLSIDSRYYPRPPPSFFYTTPIQVASRKNQLHGMAINSTRNSPFDIIKDVI